MVYKVLKSFWVDSRYITWFFVHTGLLHVGLHSHVQCEICSLKLLLSKSQVTYVPCQRSLGFYIVSTWDRFELNILFLSSQFQRFTMLVIIMLPDHYYCNVPYLYGILSYLVVLYVHGIPCWTFGFARLDDASIRCSLWRATMLGQMVIISHVCGFSYFTYCTLDVRFN